MNLLFRLIKVILLSFFRPRFGTLEMGTLNFIVWPHDLDPLFHMNNGRYLTIMDLGRFDIILRTGIGRLSLKNKWMPLVGYVSIQYKKPLRFFQRYQLQTRLIAWDEKWFYLEQRFVRKGQLFARGLVKGIFRSHQTTISPVTILSMLGHNHPSPRPPEELAPLAGS
ncbi:MAG: thioesterase family protein [Deltaproteobacteria bacterium]|nr:thioesterase family protein [Deltaproteobacteria bacterium]